MFLEFFLGCSGNIPGEFLSEILGKTLEVLGKIRRKSCKIHGTVRGHSKKKIRRTPEETPEEFSLTKSR